LGWLLAFAHGCRFLTNREVWTACHRCLEVSDTRMQSRKHGLEGRSAPWPWSWASLSRCLRRSDPQIRHHFPVSFCFGYGRSASGSDLLKFKKTGPPDRLSNFMACLDGVSSIQCCCRMLCAPRAKILIVLWISIRRLDRFQGRGGATSSQNLQSLCTGPSR
jgi:hypothetical protein